MPKENVSIGEHVMIRKTKICRMQVEVKNTATIIAEKKEDPSQRRVVAKKVTNNVLDGGIDLLLDLIVGASSDHYDSGAYLELLDSGGSRTGPGTFGPTDAGPINGGSCTDPCDRRRWEWHDNSTDTYSFQQFAMYQIDPDSGTGTPVQFNQFDFGATQSKPSDENWHLIMEIEFSSNNTNFSGGGMLRLAQRMSGEMGSPFDETNVTVQPEDGGGAAVGSEIGMDAAPTVDKSANTITMEFTSADGDNNGTWETVRLIHDHAGADVDVRDGGCKDDGSSCGTKQNAEEWTWRFIFQF